MLESLCCPADQRNAERDQLSSPVGKLGVRQEGGVVEPSVLFEAIDVKCRCSTGTACYCTISLADIEHASLFGSILNASHFIRPHTGHMLLFQDTSVLADMLVCEVCSTEPQ